MANASGGMRSKKYMGSKHGDGLIGQARARLDAQGGIDNIGFDLKPKKKDKKTRVKVMPTGGGGGGDEEDERQTSTRSLKDDQDAPEEGEEGEEEESGESEPEMTEEEKAAELRETLKRNPRIVGYDEEGEAEAYAELKARIEWRRSQPLAINDFFSGYCHEADMYAHAITSSARQQQHHHHHPTLTPLPPSLLRCTAHTLRYLPIRAKFCKKHQRVVAKFDHYCYALGNSVGELNHGRFYRLLLAQVISIWTGFWLLDHSFLAFHTTIAWTVANIPLIILNILTWLFGVPLTLLLLVHTFHCLTSSTTYEFVKLEKLEYMNGFYQFSFPFNEGLCKNIGHFCLPSGIQLWRRAPPEDEWPESFWRNRYYSCCG